MRLVMSRRLATVLVAAVIGLCACGGDSGRTTSNAPLSSAQAFSASSGPSTTSVTIDTTTSSGASGALDSAAVANSSTTGNDEPPTSGDSGPGATEPATTEPSTQPDDTTVPPPPPSTTPTTAPSSSAAITIMAFKFSPNPLAVAVGTVVTTTNAETSVSHTWTSDTGAWDSGTLAPGQSSTFTFSSAGTFKYHCSIHPTMTGSVVVS